MTRITVGRLVHGVPERTRDIPGVLKVLGVQENGVRWCKKININMTVISVQSQFSAGAGIYIFTYTRVSYNNFINQPGKVWLI